MPGSAGTPVIDSPSAVVMTSLPSLVTRSSTDSRSSSLLTCSAIRSTSRAGPPLGGGELTHGRLFPGPSMAEAETVPWVLAAMSVATQSSVVMRVRLMPALWASESGELGHNTRNHTWITLRGP